MPCTRPLTMLALAMGLGACGSQGAVCPAPEAPLGALQQGAEAIRYASWHPRSHAELCFAVEGAKDKAGAAVVLEACNGSKEQAWARFGDQLRVFNDKCLTVPAGEDGDGVKLEIDTCKDGDAKNNFDLTSADTIRWRHNSGMCVDVTDGEFEPGTQLQLWTCSEGSDNQSLGWMNAALAASGAPAAAVPTSSAPAAAAQKPAATPAVHNDNAGNKSEDAAKASTSQAASASATFAPSPKGVLVAPYYWNWSNKMTLADAYSKVNLRAATIAFGLSAGGSNACDVSGFKEIGGDLLAFRAKGGQVILSFGGAAGDYLNEKCTDVDAIAKAIYARVKHYNTKLLDFDVEGSHIANASVNQRLIDALVILQKQDPELYISFTLAVDFDSGLANEAQGLLKMAVDKKLKVSRVNIMAMDYGRAPGNGKTAGDAAIMAAEKTAAQMAKLWPKASKAEINHAIGITPMIGENDDVKSGNPAFTPADAKKVAAWAKANGIGHLAWWSFERDNATKGDLDDHSNSQSADYQFFKAFSEAQQ